MRILMLRETHKNRISKRLGKCPNSLKTNSTIFSLNSQPDLAMIVMRIAFLIFQDCQRRPIRKFILQKTTHSSFAHSIRSFSCEGDFVLARSGYFWLTDLLLVTSFVPAVILASDL